ncbi:domain found in IF2B/IF5-domain-containing protein [Blastocladiella britannica]|nr:domain found in IF2B/IF5-domain-containing protein [Blastocladiella britannica]
MSLINIGGDKDDMFYRYKMPPVQAKNEGKGNGVKTVIPNINEVGRALARPPMYPIKFFGTELGAQTKHEPKNDRYIINGTHDAQKLQDLLTVFIDKFVLCGACGNPETNLKIIDGMIERHCMACGKVTDIDMRHKLTTYILSHPPEGAVVSGGKKGPKGKRGKGAKMSKEATPAGSDDENGDDAGSGDELHKQIMSDARQLAESQMADADWADEDLSPEARKARQAELLAGVEQLAVSSKSSKGKGKAGKASKKAAATGSDDEDDDLDSDPLDALAQFVAAKPAATVATILAEVKENGIPNHLASHVLAQVLIRTDTIAADLKARAPLFKKLNAGNSRAMKYFLGGLERLVAENDAFKKVPVMLKTVYEQDLADDHAILKWGGRVTKKWTGKKELGKKVRESAEVFLEWLKEEDEDEEDSEEDE